MIIAFAFITGSVSLQVNEILKQEDISNNLFVPINTLSYLSNADNASNLNNTLVVFWNSTFNLISGNMSLLIINNFVNQIVLEMNQSLQSIKQEFNSAIQLSGSALNLTQVNLFWNQMGSQIKTLSLAALRLLSILNVEANQLIHNYNILSFSSLTVLGFFALFISLQVFGSALKSMERSKKNEEKLEENKRDLENTVVVYGKQLKDAERMAAIGQTAGMVGHDIRNPLQAITSDLYLLKEELKDLPPGVNKQSMQESIGSIEENIVYIDKIVSDLQDYTRPLNPKFEEINLKRIIDNVFVTTPFPNSINVQLKMTENIVLLTDATYLRRALTNLVNNAIQATPNGGTLIVSAFINQEKVIISVKDTGGGIAKEVKPNLFTPLFTTKAKGQGLGLAVVKRLIERLNGRVIVESEEGKGAEFIIELPSM